MSDSTFEFTDYALTRRYFAKTQKIFATLGRIAAEGLPGGEAEAYEQDIVAQYLSGLSNSFAALSAKYTMTGRVEHRLPNPFEIDIRDSGFPVFREFMQIENDLDLVPEMLFDLPDGLKLRREMINHILQFRTMPRDLQFAMSRRLYFERIKDGNLFLARNPFKLQFVSSRPPHGHRRYIAHWAVYDTQRNLPDIYIMVFDDSAQEALHEDDHYADSLSDAALKQAVSTLKLVTIAGGIDADFPTIHPKSLKRIHAGPLYSNAFTRHSKTIGSILGEHSAVPGRDWVFAWTVETLASKSVEYVRSGLFGRVQKEIYEVDRHGLDAFEAGSTAVEKFMILPLEAYQTLADMKDTPFDGVRKYVVGTNGEVVAHP